MKSFFCLGIFVFFQLLPCPVHALTFSFTYADSAGTGFNDAVLGSTRQAAMQSAAGMLAEYFVNYNVTVPFTVNSTNIVDGPLASAMSNPLSSVPGFSPTVVQNLILTGSGTSDGLIHFNFAHPWDYDDAVAADAYDFKSTVIHEVLHSLGFLSALNSSGQGTHGNPSGQPDTWFLYDQLLVSSAGTALIADDFAFTTGLLPALTGGSEAGVYAGNGVFFAGANAFAALGQNVPIFSPDPWVTGSSMHHTDDTFFNGVGHPELIMNAATDMGPYTRSLSAVEIGMLRDIGYAAVIPEPTPWALVLILAAFGVLRHARRSVRRTERFAGPPPLS
jgi:hypothetical protein